jgi:hypothetical protein
MINANPTSTPIFVSFAISAAFPGMSLIKPFQAASAAKRVVHPARMRSRR